MNGKSLMLVVGIVAVALAFALFSRRELDPNTCESRCTTQEDCMQLIADAGISPLGSTKDDRGLCNGICSALRREQRELKKMAQEMQMPAPDPSSHACLAGEFSGVKAP